MKRKKKDRSSSSEVIGVIDSRLTSGSTYTNYTVAWIVLLTGLDLIDERVSRAMAAKVGIY